MAHFAKIGMNGKVIQVLTLDNKDMKMLMALGRINRTTIFRNT